MLVLGRRKRQKIRIGEKGEITLEILEIKGGKVRISIIAPETCTISRGEVVEDDACKKQNDP